MHIILDSLAFEIAIKEKETNALEVFGNDGKTLGITAVNFVADDYCEIWGKDFLFYPEIDKTTVNQLIIFLNITSRRPSHLFG